MRESGLRPKQKRRFRPRTTDSHHSHPVAENWLAKVPTPDRPCLVWQSDFTYLETAEGWLFLAFTLDACTRRCVAHHCRPDMRAELTATTLALALQRQPPPPGLLHHSDRGVQYAAAGFHDLAAAHGLTLSMSCTANPYDNALAESFVATLKAECFAADIPPSHATAQLMDFDNRRRRHGSLGDLSQAESENHLSSTSTNP
jgi:transposase InsO family protein